MCCAANGRAEDGARALGRSVATFKAIEHRRLHSASRHLYGERHWWSRRSYEHLWPFADTWSALATLGSLPGQGAALAAAGDLLKGVTAYNRDREASLQSDGPLSFESSVVAPLGEGGEVYFDDNAWLALALLHLHDLTGTQELLALARRVFAFIISGWSTEAGWSHPGGIRWKQPVSNTSRNTCSNGPVAEVAALLYERQGEDGLLDWAIRIYEWVRNSLMRDDGLYVDQIASDGALDPTLWSYNQGTMIGAGVLLHRITKEQSYLDAAVRSARASLRDLGPEKLLLQDAAFNAVYFRNLLLLGRYVGETSYRELADRYGESMWSTALDRRTGLFRGKGSVLNRSAAMVEIYALVAGADPHP